MVTKNNLAFQVVPDVSLPEQAVSAAKVLFHQKVSMLSVLLKLLIILVLTPRVSTRLLAVRLGYLAVYSMNMSVRKLFRLPIFFVMIVR